jgi:hypothetical protein
MKPKFNRLLGLLFAFFALPLHQLPTFAVPSDLTPAFSDAPFLAEIRWTLEK